jgi:chromate transporter
MTPQTTRGDQTPVAEIIRLFLRLGITAFGGPAAHIAMMHQEVVNKRKWLSEQEFLDLLGATNLIPGPNSTEMSIHIGYRRAGWPGLILGGASFILPAMLIVLGLAFLYVSFGQTPTARWLLTGVTPVVIALVVQALWWLGRTAIKDVVGGIAGVAVVALYFFGIDNLVLLIGGGFLLMVIANWKLVGKAAGVMPLAGAPLIPLSTSPAPFSLLHLFFVFLKIGSVLYGSGYVLLAFLRADFVTRLGWLTDQQLIDAVAIGQVTPGPLFTTATFIGYLLGGLPGALLATLGIFLPSFLFVAVSAPLIPRIRESAWAGAFLDGVNVTSLGLMAAVTIQLGMSAFYPAGQIDWVAVLSGVVAGIVLIRWNVNSTWLIAAGALVGMIRMMIGA